MNPPNAGNIVTVLTAPVIKAYFGDTAGNAPDSGGESNEWHPLAWSKYAGSRVGEIQLTRSLESAIENRFLRAGSSRQVEIWFINEDGERDLILGWGETTNSRLQISSGNESEQLTATVQPRHFGEMITGEVIYNKADAEEYTQHTDVCFNPRIDNRITPNRSGEREVDDENGDGTHFLWVDPEAGRTAAAYSEHWDAGTDPTELPDLWTLDTIVETLQQVLNSGEDHFKNANVRDHAIFTDAIEAENITVKRGMFLSHALDTVLLPRGYNWCVDLNVNSSDAVEKQIRIFKRGEGPLMSLRLQSVGEDVDTTQSALTDFSCEVSLADLANQIVAHGSLVQVEATIPLQKGWSESGDNYTSSQLDRSDPDSYFDLNYDVHRQWIANEDGSWTDFRTEITETLDLSSLGEASEGAGADYFKLPKRRPLDHPLTYRSGDDEGGLRAPIKLEWREDDDSDWKQVSWPWTPLEDQLGVYFNGVTPPDEMIDNPDAELRVTGTLTGDQAIASTSDESDDSPIGSSVSMFLDVSDRFHYRLRQTTGVYASVLTGRHDERDDRDDLDTFVNTARDIEDVANIQASITLFGIRVEWDVGYLVKDIDGRGIRLNRKSNSAANPRYLQVVGIEWSRSDTSEQTTLHMESYDAPY